LDTPATDPPTPTATDPVVDNDEGPYNPNEGLVVGLAVALLALAGIIIFAVVKRTMDSRLVAEGAKDVTSVVEEGFAPGDDTSTTSSIPTTVMSEPSGPTPFEAEGTLVGTSPGKGEMQTVEII
jgi:hypothetical protein